jgi:hypothetical protein
VKHIIYDVDDVPVLPQIMDRRVNPNRRAVWRGGRRDGDWTDRPPDAWTRLVPGHPPSRWRTVLSTLHLLT